MLFSRDFGWVGQSFLAPIFKNRQYLADTVALILGAYKKNPGEFEVIEEILI